MDLSTLARACDLLRAAVDAAHGGMPDDVFVALTRDMAAAHSRHERGPLRWCEFCGGPFRALMTHHRFCSRLCCRRAWDVRQRAAA